MAMLLVTYTLLGEKAEGFSYVKKLSEALSSERWMSTQTTAYALLAVSKYLDAEHYVMNKDFSFSGGGYTDYTVSSNEALSEYELKSKLPGKYNLHVRNTGKGMLFARVITEGVPVQGPVQGFEHNLGMKVEFESKDGKVIDLNNMVQGTDFIAIVHVTNLSQTALTNLALRQIFPSGWEIGNDRMDKEDVATDKEDLFTYQDIKDDRVYTFFDLNRNETKTFRIRLTAAYLGKFYFPGTLCEAMYEGSVNAFNPGTWVTIHKE